MMDARLESFLEALNRASNTDFPVKNYVAKLTAAGLTTPVGTLISGSLSSTASMTNAVFNSVDCSSDVGQLLASAAARGLGNAQDSFGFHHRVDKDVALQLSKTSLANMMPRLYGDFLVGKLSDSNQDLGALAKDPDFVKAYQAKIADKDFILLQLIGQSASVNSFPNYFLNIFFVNEYFQNDGDFPVHVALPDRGSASGFLGLVEDYHKSLAASRPDDESNQSLGYGQRLANVISAVSHIYAPDRRLDHEIHALAGALFPSVGATESEPVASIKAYMANEASETLYSMGHRMWTAWDNEVQTFTDTMKILSSKAEPEKTIESHDNGYYVFQTEYGRAVAGLISYCRQTPSYETLFTSGAPDLSDRSSKRDGWNSNQQHWYDGGGCFVAGTQIMTLPGQSVPIERIEEGLTILTRADSNQFGTASDERVVIPLDGSEVTLFGFNDEDPFFTPNHVFFTTGGLRALDPVGAMRENAHVEVGHLQVGDVLLRTLDGQTYSAIPVESLTYQKTSEKYVYGVHLREGMRSYHANGYLVYLNYPEITLASIRKAMSTLGQDEQMRALLSLQELRPLLERFGGQAVFDAFHKQLADSASRPHLSVNLSPKQKRTLLDADISFDVVPKRTSDRPLPSLALHRGLLQVDGQSCNQYSLTSSCISWTRWVENQELWEHGCCAILPDMAGGGGVIIFSDNEVLDKMDWNGAIQVSCHARHHNPEPRSRAHSSIMAVRAVEISNVKRSVSQGMAQMANTTTIQAVSTPAAEPLIQTFDLSVDTATTPSVDPLSELKPRPLRTPTKFLQIGVQIGGVKVGAPRFDYVFPALDNLRSVAIQQISEGLAAQPVGGIPSQTADPVKMGHDIPSVYETARYAADGKVRISIRMTYPGFLVHAADANIDKAENAMDTVLQNLTFSRLLGPGSTLQLPFIFSNMELEYGAAGNTLQGYVWEYAPGAPGDMGAMHAVWGTLNTSPVPQALMVAKRSVASFALAQAPAIASNSFRKEKKFVPDVTYLLGLKVDNEGIKDAAQRIIYKAMLYYMTDDNLKNLVGDNRPQLSDSADGLPPLFAQGLEKETRDWLTNTYTPAWIALRAMQTSDVAKEVWRVKFNPHEARKVLYFWRGKGEGCLSKSGYYAKLNDLAVRVATLQKETSLNTFLTDGNADDQGRTGGAKWAAQLFDVLKQPAELRNLIVTMSTSSSNNQLQNYVNILQILQPTPLQGFEATSGTTSAATFGATPADEEKRPAVLLAAMVMSDPMFTMMKMQYICGNDASEAGQFRDVMKQMLDLLLSNNSVFGNEIQQMLMKDLQVSVDLQLKDKAATWLKIDTALSQTASYSRFLRLIGTYKGITQFAPELSFMRRLQLSTDILLGENKVPLPADVNMVWMRRLFILVGYTYLSIAAWGSFKNWDSMSNSQKAMVVINTSQGTLGLLRYSFNGIGSWEGFGPNGVGRGLVPQWWRDLSAASAEFRMSSSANTAQMNTYRYQTFLRYQYDPQVCQGYRHWAESARIQLDPAYNGAKFNWRANWFRVAMCGFNFGLSIVMGIDLFSNWSNRPLVDDILNTIVWASITLTFLMDVVVILALANKITLGATALAVCSWLGPVLAIIGIIAALTAFIVSCVRGPELAPLEKWVQDSGHQFVENLGVTVKNPRLAWSATKVSAGQFNIVGTNSSTTPQTLSTIDFNFTSGGSDGTLFSGNGPFTTSGAAGQTNTVAISSSSFPTDSKSLKLSVNQGSTQQGIMSTSSTVTQWLVRADTNGEDITIPAGGAVTFSLSGAVNGTGKFAVVVTETFPTDNDGDTDTTTASLVLNK